MKTSEAPDLHLAAITKGKTFPKNLQQNKNKIVDQSNVVYNQGKLLINVYP